MACGVLNDAWGTLAMKSSSNLVSKENAGLTGYS